MKSRYITLAVIVGFTWLIVSCKSQDTVIPNEPNKDISGKWKIVGVTRNNTALFDLRNPLINPGHFAYEPFLINFNTDNSFTTTDDVPFITSNKGKWDLDQPFAKTISFTDAAGVKSSLDFLYPVTAGIRQLVITFSPGCKNNTYIYTLERAN